MPVHLFPNLPAPNLRKAQPIVAEYCSELGVSYLATDFATSYGQALRHLHDVGVPALSRVEGGPWLTFEAARTRH
jgi:hypothetical protein